MIVFGWKKRELEKVEELLYQEKKANRKLEDEILKLKLEIENHKLEIFTQSQIIAKRDKEIQKLKGRLNQCKNVSRG